MTKIRSKINKFQRVRLTVLSGPDIGLSRNFPARQPMSVGRGARNGLILTDGFVSNEHGELCLQDGALIYRDLNSRHGSTVLVDDVSMQLKDATSAQQVHLDDGAEIQVGRTLIRVDIEKPGADGPESGEIFTATSTAAAFAAEDSADDTREVHIDEVVDTSPHIFAQNRKTPGRTRETMITSSLRRVESIPRDFADKDDSLAILFRLAGELNSQTQLDDILELIVDAVFQAFPAANFFAITLADDPREIVSASPFLTRVRGKLPGRVDETEAPVLSKSILGKVVETRQSVLFVRDSLGDNISQSILDAQITACLCAPLVGQHSLLGIMQVDTRGMGGLFSKQDLNLFSVFASNVAFAMERAKLSENIVEMFESFVEASVNAIEARDPTTAGHSERVADYTVELAGVVNEIAAGRLADIFLDRSELKELRYAALLHDFGKIAVRESVLSKEKRLPQEHLDLVAQRFETVKALDYQRLIRGHFGAASESMNPALFRELETRHAANCRELDAALEFLLEAAAAPFLEDSQIERVRRIGARQFVGPDGERRPLLSPTEIENLTIRRGTLNAKEWDDMKAHARRSQEYLERIPWGKDLQKVPCIAGAHHEKLDGSGYPHGLGAAEILPQVRMLTIADIFDALTAADRPYRKAASPTRAVEILRLEAGDNKLDADLVEIFAERVVPVLGARLFPS
jgi:HD-GYP domain-containing protein (c-di-GMP phosphodiesterase class II)